MPIKIPRSLPAKEILEGENIFVMDEDRAVTQDIRPLKICILNLMPTKIVTETQLLRLLSNTPLQVDITLLNTVSHRSKNTAAEHLETFYKTFADVRNDKYDGLIVTGAPVERLDFTDVDYWDELCGIMEWAKTHVYSSLYVCWGAFAGLYYNHGIDKHPLEQKLSGVFRHRTLLPAHPLLRGFNEAFSAPHSRYSCVERSDIESNPSLLLLADSPRPAFISPPPPTDGRFTSPAIPNTTPTRCGSNICATAPSTRTRRRRCIISRKITPRCRREHLEGATRIFCIPTG